MEKTGSAEVGHTHADVSGGWLRPAVFGAMDGLVTNIALVAGVGGAGANGHVIVLSGTAGLVAGAFSMALGEYTSVGTQNNAVDAEAAIERDELERNPEAEQAELVQMYREMGLTESTAKLAAKEIHANPEMAIRVHLTQELGLDPDEQPSPVVAAISSFLCFAALPVRPPVALAGPGHRRRGAVPGRRDRGEVHPDVVVAQWPASVAVRCDRDRGDLRHRCAHRRVSRLNRTNGVILGNR
jgi:VIT1/CCC1 family predicted Fe2+/Mn2+ transporter